MPGVLRYDLASLNAAVQEFYDLGLRAFLLFGLPAHKDAQGSGAWDDQGIVQQALRQLRGAFSDIYLIADVCLCAYTEHGQCGVVNAQGVVQNAPTVALLAQVAVSYARAGADMVAPSDMMDHRVGQIRTALDDQGFATIPIMAYSAKFASAFYGPFREAAQSAPQIGDRKSYQLNPANLREALREGQLDENEGADLLMVKPAMAYLDVIYALRQQSALPIVAYQVSGEYAMIKAAALQGWLDERSVVMEALLAMKRAGASLIITYFAPQVALWFRS